jgi:DNA invertase Pin-like site-specific DNA recombinase
MARKSRKPGVQATPEVTKIVTYKTWVYARISKDSDRADDSVENQIAIAREYIDGDAELTFCGAISDTGFTGTNFDRPGYAELLAGIIDGTVKCLCVKDLSRVGRTYIEVGEFIFDTLVQYGVRFISVNDRYDSFADDAGRKKLLILFKNLINSMYSKDLGRKIKSAHDTKKRRGEIIGSVPPYGYRFTDDGKHYKIEPTAAEVVKRIFDMRLQGISATKIADTLNADAVPSPLKHYVQLGLQSSKKDAVKAIWKPKTICGILSSEVCLGHQIQNKFEIINKKQAEKPREEWIRHENTHEAIVTAEQFDAVQVLMAATRDKYKHVGNKEDENIFAGRIFCSKCGQAAWRISSRHGNTVKYHYHCRFCCKELKRELGLNMLHHFPLKKLETVVTESIQKQIDVCLEIDNLLAKVAATPAITRKRIALTQERDKLKKEGETAVRLLSAAYAHHLDGLLDGREFELARVKFERDKQNAETRLAQVEAELSEVELETVCRNEYLENFRKYRWFDKLDREIIIALIKRIELTPMTNEIAITFNFGDNFTKLKNLIQESEVLTDVY